MAIVVLVLWLFTAGAGFYLLATSNLGRARPAAPSAAGAGRPSASVSAERPALASAAGPAGPPGQPPQTPSPGPASRREMRRAVRDRWDPPSLTAAKQAPVIPGARSLVEFAHPAFAIIGLGFWLGFTLIHNHALGWIAFGLVAVTAGLGLTWFTANVRAGRRGGRDRQAPDLSGRLMVLHGSAAAVTISLAALTAVITRG